MHMPGTYINLDLITTSLETMTATAKKLDSTNYSLLLPGAWVNKKKMNSWEQITYLQDMIAATVI